MKIIGILLFLLLSFEVVAGVGDVTIGNLPGAEDENFKVCYDQVTGQLGNCPNVRGITVNCPSESINTKLADVSQGNWVNVTINGTCEENIEISGWGIQLRNVSFYNGVNGKIIGVDSGKATISVWGNSTIFLHGLEISGNGWAGVAARSGASVIVTDCTITNNLGTGLESGYGSYMYVTGSTVGPNGTSSAVKAVEGGTMLITTGNTLISANAIGIDGTIGVYGGSTVRLQDINSVSNSVAGGEAIDLGRNSAFRQRGSHATIEGGVKIVNMSYADFNNASITGAINVKRFGELRLLGGTNTSVTGVTTVGELGLIQINDDVVLNNDVNCVDGGKNSVDSGTPGGSGLVNCPLNQ